MLLLQPSDLLFAGHLLVHPEGHYGQLLDHVVGAAIGLLA